METIYVTKVSCVIFLRTAFFNGRTVALPLLNERGTIFRIKAF